uniref:CCR4-NOT transcription complex subunit 3-like isoform X1 n=1 Tax=Rhizophora mucronata TaxID=61149 RepID=A0A2P2MGC7_RHIMU
MHWPRIHSRSTKIIANSTKVRNALPTNDSKATKRLA